MKDIKNLMFNSKIKTKIVIFKYFTFFVNFNRNFKILEDIKFKCVICVRIFPRIYFNYFLL